MARLSASILSSDFSKLAEEVAKTEKGGASLIHVDVMDGHFVPNISFGAAVMKSLCKKTKLPFDVHLMIENPDQYIPDFVTEDTEYITVHSEACVHLDRTLNFIKEKGIKAGVALNPATPVSAIANVLGEVDMVLIMSVNPGFGGQKFIPYTLDKVRELEKLRKNKGYGYMIEIDGGADLGNLKDIKEAGTDIVVAGSAIFAADDVLKTTQKFCKIL